MRRTQTACHQCGKPTFSKKGICQSCHIPVHPQKSPCTECGRMTQRKEGIRWTCSRDEPAEPEETNDDHGLIDGHWEPNRRGIQVWIPRLAATREALPGEPARRCKGCPVTFFPTHMLQRYCTSQCSKRAQYRRRLVAAASPGRPVEAKAKDRAEPLPVTNVLRQFTDDECRDGRARYAQGDRSPVTLAQNREYGRVMKAAARQRNKTRPRKAA